jgi:cell division septation protein DedD
LAAAVPAGAFVVQVAAVSSQDVADILVSSLQKKGYAVAVHQVPQDKLLHVQIGPFADRAAADAMRQRVLADGFNAIVK